MPAFTARAPGKAILFGEHAVVYGRPAIAVPVTQVYAKVTVIALLAAPEGQILIDAPDIDLQSDLAHLPDTHPLRLLFNTLTKALGIKRIPALRLRISSTIPVAAGLGSGAAVSVASLRALAAFLGRPLDDEQVCDLAFEVEKAYHGNPSGIDNTVITYSRPIYFRRESPFEILNPAQSVTLVIADSGIASPTAAAVAGVRQRWQSDQAHYEALFDRIAEITDSARQTLEHGLPQALGPLMNANHWALQEMDVSSVELDRLIEAALSSGAYGAKLSGAGVGGNVIALAPPERAGEIAAALSQAGAVRTIVTTIQQASH